MVVQESAVGFDTAVKAYSQLVGNTAIDGASARKYWYFMRVMGQARSPPPKKKLSIMFTKKRLTNKYIKVGRLRWLGAC